MIARLLLFCGLPVLLYCVSPIHQQITNDEASATLQRFCGVDLTKISEKDAASLSSALELLKVEKPSEYDAEFGRLMGNHSQLLWKSRRIGKEPCFVLVESQGVTMHPGSTDIRIATINSGAKSFIETTFTTGWRYYLTKVELKTDGNGADPIMTFATAIGHGWPDDWKIARQYYARIGNRFDLVRIEGPDGAAIRNNCVYDHFRCGPSAPLQSVEQWEADLSSPDRLKVLRALTWLGSVHREPEMNDSGGELETKADVTLLGELRARNSVVTRIKELENSKDKWIREAAALASHPTDRW